MRFTFSQLGLHDFALGDVRVRNDGPRAGTRAQGRDDHLEPSLLRRGMAGILQVEPGQSAVQHSLYTVQGL